MTTLHVLDVPENTGVAKVAAEDPAVSVGRTGRYFEITARGAITIDRRATGSRPESAIMSGALGATDLTTATVRGLHFGGPVGTGEPAGNELAAAEIIA